MRENITADWARKTAESILGEKINKQIDIKNNRIFLHKAV